MELSHSAPQLFISSPNPVEGEERWVETLQTSYLVHGEVGEQDDKVLLHSDDEAGVALVSPGDHLHVVAHPEIFSHLVSRELQRVLHGAHTGQGNGNMYSYTR